MTRMLSPRCGVKRSGPAERLCDFMTDTGRNVTTLARDLSITHTMVGHLIAGRRAPGLRLAVAIETLTSAWRRGPLRAVEWTSAHIERGES